MPKPTTFAEARKQCLASLDEAFAKLRAAVADPSWVSIQVKGYAEAHKRLEAALECLRVLNECELNLRG